MLNCVFGFDRHAMRFLFSQCCERDVRGHKLKFKSPIREVDQTTKKPPQLSPGDPCALAAFVTRPQAELQIGAEVIVLQVSGQSKQNQACSPLRFCL